MRSTEAGSKARAVTDIPCLSHLRGVASANVRSTLAVARRALAVARRGALAMNRLRVLRMRRRLA